jgi:hypothetical protein
MTALPLAFLLVLSGIGTPARNEGPRATAVPATGAPAAEASDAEIASQVRSYLGAIDTPVSEERWRSLGARAVAPLEAVVRDPRALPSRRARAVEALSVIGGERARAVVVETARSEREPFAVRASALRGAPRVLPAKELSSQLRPVMERARAAPVRAAAAEVLAGHAGASSCKAVKAQAAREASAGRGRFSRALSRCEAANGAVE